jgi:hypothetical protein
VEQAQNKVIPNIILEQLFEALTSNEVSHVEGINNYKQNVHVVADSSSNI